LREFAAAEGVAASTASEDRDRWRRSVRRLAYRASHAVNRATRVTANALVAAAFLDRPERAVPLRDIEAEVPRLRDWAHALGAPLTDALGVPGTPESPAEAIRRVVERWTEAKLVALTGSAGRELMSVEDRHRIRLDYYRNGVQHFFLEPALVALGLLDRRGEGDLPARVNRLARLWKNEFVYADEADALPGVERGLAFLVEAGGVDRDVEGNVRTRDAALLRRFGRALLPCIESYRVLLLVLERMPGTRRRPDVVKACLAEAERLHLRGELACYEARNRFVFENALHGFRELGLLEIVEGDVRIPAAIRASDRLVEERNHLAHLAADVAHPPNGRRE
jgi:glycerol-3-phosphate O-acyltransferase